MIDANGDLPEVIARLVAEVADLKRRLRNKVRTGTVAQVDAARGLVRVKLNDDEDGEFLTGWIPWKERAGVIRTWCPPSVGEQVTVVSENGDLTDAYCDTGTFSNANPAPHDKGGEFKQVIGSASIWMTGDRIELAVGGAKAVLTADKISLHAPEIVTYGTTRLNDGNKPVHRIGDTDSDGDAAVTGADGVFA